ncbi:putative transmembrane protein [Cyclospora cayetanensis]|uniref:Transmembrane protein n=1 Tax=Cyclospora cayetanensis TaxID=88456 RepID=A0A1D3D320_9EIME|nr:putative transmembrane protein [Cyclospora cayetanensis]
MEAFPRLFRTLSPPSLLPFSVLCLLCLISALQNRAGSNGGLPHLSSASAHIHVAPEYFQRCDALPPSTPFMTGGAWLLREISASGSPQICSGSLGVLFGCKLQVEPDIPATFPRQLEALEEGISHTTGNAGMPHAGDEATVASAAAGYLLQNAAAYSWIPGPVRALLRGGLVIQIISALALLLFGIWHLYKAKASFPAAGRGPHRRASRRFSVQLSAHSECMGDLRENLPDGASPVEAKKNQGTSVDEEEQGVLREGSADESVSTRPSPTEWPLQDEELQCNLEEAQEDLERLQYSRLGLAPESWQVLREVFLLILLAEWGDKSMFTTVSLAAAQNPWGVFLGSCIGHALVTAAGVMGGLLLQRWLNEFSLNLAAGIIMIAVGLGHLGSLSLSLPSFIAICAQRGLRVAARSRAIVAQLRVWSTTDRQSDSENRGGQTNRKSGEQRPELVDREGQPEGDARNCTGVPN